MNITDICEICDREIISCLKQRFINDDIYTYVAKVLIAINPYHPINGMYSPKKIEAYCKDTKDELPPHLFSIANRVISNISLRPQSIILTGQTGSGKTNSAMHLLSFISKSKISLTGRVIATNIIFEAFGNAKTSHNYNSSRFSKLTEVYLCHDQQVDGVQMSYLLLESSRIYGQNSNESNFHIFHAITSAASTVLRNLIDLHLDEATNYAYLPEYQHNEEIKKFHDFALVDNALVELGVSNEGRIKIYKILGAILHLGNVTFEKNSCQEGCQITFSTRNHFIYAAQLLEIEQEILEEYLLKRKMEVRGSDPILIPLDHLRANNVKNSLCQFIYENTFHDIVVLVNKNMASSVEASTRSQINLLDIAGFESFNTNNHFEQLCINFINEKVQQMFVKIMLKKEEEWYKSESLEVPKIPFLDNDPILDVFENKYTGIFKILDDTGKMQSQTTSDFVQNVFNNWTNTPILVKPKIRGIQENSGFIIRHFVGDVFYNVDNFVDKNLNILPKGIDDLFQDLGISKRSSANNKSTTFILKTGTNELIKNLSETECSFVRCIKPNASQSRGIFDENVVESQLISSGSIAYQQLMKAGFPSHLSIAEVLNKFKSCSEFQHVSYKNQKDFCTILLRACCLKWIDFKLGNTQIFFRKGKIQKFYEKLKQDPKKIKEHIDQLILLRKKFRVAIIFARFCAIGIVCRKKSNELMNEVQSEEHVDIPAKKFTPNKKSKKKLAQSPPAFDDELPSASKRSKHTWTTIGIQSNDDLNLENQLRTLLRQAEKKNEALSEDYRSLQKQNVELSTRLQKVEKENDKLMCENRKFRKNVSYITLEHDYQMPE